MKDFLKRIGHDKLVAYELVYDGEPAGYPIHKEPDKIDDYVKELNDRPDNKIKITYRAFEENLNEELTNWEQYDGGLVLADRYIQLVMPIDIEGADLDLVALIFQNRRGLRYGYELSVETGADTTLISEGSSDYLSEVIDLCLGAIKEFDEKNDTDIIYNVKPLEPSKSDMAFLQESISESKINEGAGAAVTIFFDYDPDDNYIIDTDIDTVIGENKITCKNILITDHYYTAHAFDGGYILFEEDTMKEAFVNKYNEYGRTEDEPKITVDDIESIYLGGYEHIYPMSLSGSYVRSNCGYGSVIDWTDEDMLPMIEIIAVIDGVEHSITTECDGKYHPSDEACEIISDPEQAEKEEYGDYDEEDYDESLDEISDKTAFKANKQRAKNWRDSGYVRGKEVFTVDIFDVELEETLGNLNSFYSFEKALEYAREEIKSFYNEEALIEALIYSGEYENDKGEIWGEPEVIYAISNKDRKTTAKIRKQMGYARTDVDEYPENNRQRNENMNIKEAIMKSERLLNEAKWDNFAGHSLPNGDKDDRPIEVVFKKENDDVLALFPKARFDNSETIPCYVIHSTLELKEYPRDRVGSLENATVAEYSTLKKELESMGYNLVINENKINEGLSQKEYEKIARKFRCPKSPKAAAEKCIAFLRYVQRNGLEDELLGSRIFDSYGENGEAIANACFNAIIKECENDNNFKFFVTVLARRYMPVEAVLNKLEEAKINEISDELANKVAKKRQNNFKNAERNFDRAVKKAWRDTENLSGEERKKAIFAKTDKTDRKYTDARLKLANNKFLNRIRNKRKGVNENSAKKAIDLYKKHGMLFLDDAEGKKAYRDLLNAGYTMKKNSAGDVAYCVELDRMNK